MKINSLTLENFRKFDRISCTFDDHLTVLIAANGEGKTTLLDAVRIALLPFVKGFDLGSQTGKSATIQPEDVRLVIQESGNMEPQLPSSITALGNWDKDEWTQTRAQIKKNTNTLQDKNTKKLNKYAKTLQEKSRSGEPVVLPLITYLGTSRLWYQGRYRAETSENTLDVNDYSRTSGYLNCLSYTSSFKAFADWYSWICHSYDEASLRAWKNNAPLDEMGQRFEDTISVIQSSVDMLVKEITGWHSLEYSSEHHQQLVMHHPTEGTLPVDMLSDALRNMIAMIADMAFRSYKLNPQFGKEAALKTPGIALIDEVDMFLHPKWQQTILASLQNAFPEIQFIVTTHSPQVLSTVHSKSIRILGKNNEGKYVAVLPIADFYGSISSDSLESIMYVNPQPPVAEKIDLDRLTELVDQGHNESPEVDALFDKLETAFGKTHPQLQKLRRSIRRQEILKPTVTKIAPLDGGKY